MSCVSVVSARISSVLRSPRIKELFDESAVIVGVDESGMYAIQFEEASPKRSPPVPVVEA
jgi:hypothetical protein